MRWELITSKKTKKGNNIYSFRFSQKYRAAAYRDDKFLVMLDLFVDHDSTYKFACLVYSHLLCDSLLYYSLLTLM